VCCLRSLFEVAGNGGESGVAAIVGGH